MGDVFKPPNTKFYWAWVHGPGGKLVRKSMRQTDKVAARAVKRNLERLYADPDSATTNQTTVERALAQFYRFKEKQDKAPATIKMYRQKGGHIVRIFGAESPLSVFTAASVDQFVDQRENEGAVPHTIHKELTTVRGMLKVAKRRGEFRGDISEVLPVGYSAKYEPRKTFLTWEQLHALLGKLPPGRKGHVAYVIATGARRAESFRARRSDVVGEFVRVRGTKTEESERFNPAVEMYAELLAMALEDSMGHDVLFDPWPNARRGILRACKRAGVPDVTWNDLRRTFASLLKQRGVTNDVLGSLLGHAPGSPMAARVYGHDTPATLKATLERQLAPTDSVIEVGPKDKSED